MPVALDGENRPANYLQRRLIIASDACEIAGFRMRPITMDIVGVAAVEVHADRWFGGTIRFIAQDGPVIASMSTNWLRKARRLLYDRQWSVVEG